MGEVRAKFRLTNAIDEGLARRGQLAEDKVRSYEAEAVVDTGAVQSVIPPHVLQALGVLIQGQRIAEYADGRQDPVGVTEPILFEWQGRRTYEEALVLGAEILIGQTILEKMDLLPDCGNQRLIPNPAHPNQPVSKIRSMRGHQS
jgi:clan AA aspartic protease